MRFMSITAESPRGFQNPQFIERAIKLSFSVSIQLPIASFPDIENEGGLK